MDINSSYDDSHNDSYDNEGFDLELEELEEVALIEYGVEHKTHSPFFIFTKTLGFSSHK